MMATRESRLRGLQTAPGEGRESDAGSARAAILATARQLFSTQGYSSTSIADIVAAAGTSVGLPYYYFGSKSNIFLAIYREYQVRQRARTTGAVLTAQADGVAGVDLLAVGVRAYLEGAWVDRELIPLIHGRDVPSDLQPTMESQAERWSEKMLRLLPEVDEQAAKRSLILLSDALSAACLRLARCTSDGEAAEWADLAVNLTRSLLRTLDSNDG
jgi:AcrR family transcriptional regulator